MQHATQHPMQHNKMTTTTTMTIVVTVEQSSSDGQEQAQSPLVHEHVLQYLQDPSRLKFSASPEQVM